MNTQWNRKMDSTRPALGRVWAVLLGMMLAWTVRGATELVAVPEAGIRIARGFRLTLYADATLANDIRAMTLDSQGRVVVTGPGYIKTLLDENGDGVADSSVIFAPTQGGQGLCFDSNTLYFVGDGGLMQFQDDNGDGMADGPPALILPLAPTEFGGHAIHRGPEGWWYVSGGNESGFEARHNVNSTPLVPRIEGGAVLRISPDGAHIQVLAHGFRNPTDFVFNMDGDLFTCDTGAESERFLPGFAPARLLHVECGGHYGWRGRGRISVWSRPEYYADVTEAAAALDHATPTGMTCYRHIQFPPYYRGGFFLLDWELGRVLFVGQQVSGASYECAAEVFLDSLGTAGFTPTGLAVAPNGSLYICTGGHKSRGAVYRIDYVGGATPALPPATLNPELNGVLMAAQPFEAWSRALWQPKARLLGPEAFLPVVTDDAVPSVWRVRAIEILTEMFGGLSPIRALAGSRAADPVVRARVAWSVGLLPKENAAAILLDLASDRVPLVRRNALEALLLQPNLDDSPALARVLLNHLADSDKGLRQLAARIASRLSDVTWQGLQVNLEQAAPALRVNGLLARLWREGEGVAHPEVVRSVSGMLGVGNPPEVLTDALRVLLLALGDVNSFQPSEPLYTGYELLAPPGLPEADLVKLCQALRLVAASSKSPANAEASRLLAMLADDDPRLPAAVLCQATNDSPATLDFHYLTCLTRYATQPPALAPRIADALLNLDQKLAGNERNPRLSWETRLADLGEKLWTRDPRVAESLLRHPRLVASAHEELALRLQNAQRLAAARVFLAAVRPDSKLAWSTNLLNLLSALPPAEARPVFRQQWSSAGLRDQILLKLAAWPEAADRPRYFEGLTSPDLTVVRASLSVLLQLPSDPAATNLLAPLSLLRRLLSEPAAQDLRPQTVRLLSHLSGLNFLIIEQEATPEGLRRVYQPVFDALGRKYPQLTRSLNQAEAEDVAAWMSAFRQVAWNKGEPARGERFLVDRGCIRCHSGPSSIGPLLGGIAARSTPENLLLSVVFPNREIAPAYQATQFYTRDRQLHHGLVLYDSPTVLILQTGAGQTERLLVSNIVWQRPSDVSIMPTGLLRGLKLGDLADLAAALKALSMVP